MVDRASECVGDDWQVFDARHVLDDADRRKTLAVSVGGCEEVAVGFTQTVLCDEKDQRSEEANASFE